MKINEFIQSQLEALKNKGTLIAACSGGIDSTTSAYLANEAVGTRVHAFVIDDGLRREQEPEEAEQLLRKLGIKTEILRKQERFLTALQGLTDPEEKRKKFRKVFYSVLKDVLVKHKTTHLLQGTIKADIDETKGNEKERIKTQHNVLQQIGVDYGFQVVEPLKDLYKNQVRDVARALGLPSRISERMPFPGPGLAIRIVGAVTPEKVEVVRQAHVIVESTLREKHPFQVFPVLLNDKATGILKGKRAYGNIIAIRCVESEDARTAKPTEIAIGTLKNLAERICEQLPTVTRVVYDVTPKPPGTIEFE